MTTQPRVYAHTETTLKTGDIYLGKDSTGLHHWVSVRLTEHNRELPRTTVNHQQVTQYTSFAASGMITSRKSLNDRYFISGGQCLDQTIAAGILTGGDMSDNDRLMILDYWEALHLNDMRPGCIHQPKTGTYDENQHAPCPVGYKYGSQWLVRMLPPVVESNIRQLIQKHRGK